MKYIKISSSNKRIIVDNEDHKRVSEYRWHLDQHGYPKRSLTVSYDKINGQRTTSLYLHRFITGAEKGKIIDHINGNPLDNRKANLRFCTRSQNQWNRGITSRNNGKFKGVSFHKREGKWRAAITAHRNKFYLGIFDNPIDAARAYNEAAKKYHGEFALLNKI